MKTFVLASDNRGKLRELSALFSGLNVELRAQSEFDIDAIEEGGLSFIENALLKARHAASVSGLPAIADDSGLVVDALRGQPGLYSARFAGDKATDEENVSKLLSELEQFRGHHRRCRFVCTMVLLRHAEDPMPLIAQGQWRGRVLETPQGSGGFGYDPVFQVVGRNESAAELPPAIKNRISHRAEAGRRLVQRIIDCDLLDA